MGILNALVSVALNPAIRKETKAFVAKTVAKIQEQKPIQGPVQQPSLGQTVRQVQSTYTPPQQNPMSSFQSPYANPKIQQGVIDTGKAIVQDFTAPFTKEKVQQDVSEVKSTLSRGGTALNDFLTRNYEEARKKGLVKTEIDMAKGVYKGAVNFVDELGTSLDNLFSAGLQKVGVDTQKRIEENLQARTAQQKRLAPKNAAETLGGFGANLAIWTGLSILSEGALSKGWWGVAKSALPSSAQTMAVSTASDLLPFGAVNAVLEHSDADFDTKQWFKNTVGQAILGATFERAFFRSAPKVVKEALGEPKIKAFYNKLKGSIDKMKKQGYSPEEIEARIQELGSIPQMRELFGQKVLPLKEGENFVTRRPQEAFLGGREEITPEELSRQGEKIRGFPERIGNYEEFQELLPEIKNNPELRYKPQKIQEIKEKVDVMTDLEKVDAMTDIGRMAEASRGDNLGVLAGAKLLKEQLARGEDVTAVLETMSKAGTTMGQLIRQFAEIKGSTPEGVLLYVQKELAKFDRKLPKQVQTELTGLVGKYFKDQNYANELKTVARETLDKKDLYKYRQIQKAADLKSVEIQKKISAIVPKKFWSQLGMLAQGNLLTPLSQIVNIVGNVTFAIPRATARELAIVSDKVFSFITGRPRTIMSGSGKEISKGFVEGTVSAVKKLKTGLSPNDLGKIDIDMAGFQPIRAFVQAFTGKDMPIKKSGKVAVTDRGKKLIEGLLGAPPEAMFRALNLGDAPFSTPVYRNAIAEYAKLKNLTGDDFKRELLFPSSENIARAKLLASQSIFTGESKIFNSLEFFFKKMGIDDSVLADFSRFAIKTLNFPYFKTPINFAHEYARYVIPKVSVAEGIYHAVRGNRREALMAFSRATVGMSMGALSVFLVEKGISTGNEEVTRVRNGLYEIIPPNHTNMTAIKRIFGKIKNGEEVTDDDFEYRPGEDQLRDHSKLGIFGASIAISQQQKNREARTEKREEEGRKVLRDSVTDTVGDVLGMFDFVMEQSVLQGADSLFKALAASSDEDENKRQRTIQKWLQGYIGVLTSIAIPNTFAALTRGNEDTIPELTSDNTMENINRIIKARTFDTGGLPQKRTLWGEKIDRNPDDENGYARQLFGIVREADIEKDDTNAFLYRLYKKTNDPTVWPNAVPRTLTYKGITIDLNEEEYEQLQEFVGRIRKKKVDTFLDRLEKSDTEIQLSKLGDFYEDGYSQGKKELLQANPEILERIKFLWKAEKANR